MKPTEVFEVDGNLIESLACLYKYESSLLNVSGNVGKEFDISWTKSKLRDILHRWGGDPELAGALFDFLESNRRLVPLSEGGYRTDTCELVRLSSFNYNRRVKEDDTLIPTQTGATWSVEEKMTPVWEWEIAEVKSKLISEFEGGWDEDGESGSYSDPQTLIQASDIVLNAFERSIWGEEPGEDEPEERKEWEERRRNVKAKLSRFQYRSLRDLIRGSKSTGKSTQVIKAGTGSGKSYGFQLGALISLVHDQLSPEPPTTVHTIFMYPRVALAIDQANGIRLLIEQVNKSLPTDKQIRYAIDASGLLIQDGYPRLVNPKIKNKELQKISTRPAIKEIYGNPNNCPHVLICNPDTITNRLWNPISIAALSNSLRHLVFDEIHLLDSINGANSSMVIRRLLAATQNKSEVMLTGSTATVADPAGHAAKVFNRNEDDVCISTPDIDDDPHELTGIVNHVIHKSDDGVNLEGNLSNLTSIITHSRRRRLTIDTDEISDRQKTIGFADALHLLGAWNFFYRDLEGVEYDWSKKRALERDHGKLTRDQAPMPYPHPYRFNRPLVKSVQRGIIKGISEDMARKHCASCIEGSPSSIPISTDDGFAKICIDQNKERGTIWEPGNIEEVGITDGCPYFRMGLCWREEQEAEYEHLFDGGPKLLGNAKRGIILSSSTISSLGGSTDSANDFFKTDTGSFYNFLPNTRRRIEELDCAETYLDIALSSPSMEVGVDLDNLNEAVLFKAIRNIASYRQKVGRIGRERFRDTYAATLVSFRAIDYHYYRNPAPLLNEDRLDTIPLGVENSEVRKQACFHAIFDWLSLSPDNPSYPRSSEIMAMDPRRDSGFIPIKESLEHARHRVISNSGALNNYLKNELGEFESTIRDESIDQAVSVLGIFLEEYPGLFKEGNKGLQRNCLADFLGWPVKNIELTPEGDTYREICLQVYECLSDLISFAPALRNFDIDGVEGFVNNLRKSWMQIERGERAPELALAFKWAAKEINEFKLNKFAKRSNREYPGLRASMNEFLEYGDNFLCGIEEGGQIKELLDKGEIALGYSIGQWRESTTLDSRSKWWYLSDVAAGLQLTQHRTPFVFPDNLFEAPNLSKVNVFIPQGEEDGERKPTPINEVLYAYAPGMWTYRQGGRALKSKAYKSLIETSSPGTFLLPLWGLEKDQSRGNHKIVEDNEIPADRRPWATELLGNPDSITIAKPIEIVLMNSRGNKDGREVWLSKNKEGAVADGDDIEEDEGVQVEEDDTSISNMPTCHAIQWRNISERDPVQIEPHKGPLKELNFHPDPLMESLFDGVVFDSMAVASEYTFGHSRKYTGKEGPDIMYVNNGRDQRTVALGHSFNSHAIRFKVSPQLLLKRLDAVWELLNSEDSSAHRIRFLGHLLMDRVGLNKFQSDHVFRMIIRKHGTDHLNGLSSWIQAISEISASDISDYSEAFIATGKPDPKLGTLAEMVHVFADLVNLDVGKEVDLWGVRTLTNSLGISILQAGNSMAGCRDQDLGYHVQMSRTCGREDLEDVHIWIYDRSPDGNGTCQTIVKWFQIPAEVRNLATQAGVNYRNLPSEDFVSTLTRFLRPCAASESEAVAIAAVMDGIDMHDGDYPTRCRDFNHLKNSFSDTWQTLEEAHGYGPRRHSEAYLMADFLVPNNKQKSEAIRKGTRRCEISCPECLEEFGVSALGSLIGPTYANKRLLDDMVKSAMQENPDIFLRKGNDLDSLAETIESLGEIDYDSPPHELTTSTGRVILRPMKLSEELWSEIDIEDPIDQSTGRAREYIWVKTYASGWTR